MGEGATEGDGVIPPHSASFKHSGFLKESIQNLVRAACVEIVSRRFVVASILRQE